MRLCRPPATISPPLEQTVFPTVSYMRVFAKFEGDDLGKVVSLRYVNFTIFYFQDNCIFGDVYKNSGIVKYFKSVLRIETLISLQFEIKYERIFYYRNL